jgi:hypothetical protein
MIHWPLIWNSEVFMKAERKIRRWTGVSLVKCED